MDIGYWDFYWPMYFFFWAICASLIFSKTWRNVFSVDDTVYKKLMDMVNDVFSGEYKEKGGGLVTVFIVLLVVFLVNGLIGAVISLVLAFIWPVSILTAFVLVHLWMKERGIKIIKKEEKKTEE